ncbi:MAG: phage portal protein [Eubacteriales bacterium]|nr:phage portal protein [Eubacteriales bacterium]
MTRNAALLENGAPDGELLRGCLREWRSESPRLQTLRDYVQRRHPIDGRARRCGLPNNRLGHDLPGYIAQTAAGYLLGEPVEYKGDAKALEAVLSAYAASDTQSEDCELAVDAACYGRAVELCYADEQARPRVAQADPLRCFVVYGDDALHRPLFGVATGERRGADGRSMGALATVYTAEEIIRYEGPGLDALTESGRERHFFGGVPMIEYWNNARETGDFESVLPLIDAYDALQSDRVNDKQQFTDAILVLYGVSGLTSKEGDARQRLREEKTLCMPDGDARVEFLTKQLSESDTEVLRKSLCEDIHKLSFVPDLSDRDFAGNQSGVALRFKLFGLTQLTRIKERWFREGLRTRLRLMSAFLSLSGAPALDADAVDIVFHRAQLWEEGGQAA